MGDLLDNIEAAANGHPYNPYSGRVSIDPERIRLAREIQRMHKTVDFDFSHNIKNLKCLQMILEKNGYPYSTVKTVQDTIKYLEEKEKESK